MVNNSPSSSTTNIQFTWKAILWRLLLTALLLLSLLGSNLAIFGSAAIQPDTHVLPPLTFDTDAGGQE